MQYGSFHKHRHMNTLDVMNDWLIDIDRALAHLLASLDRFIDSFNPTPCRLRSSDSIDLQDV